MIHVQDDNSFHIRQTPSITTHTTRSNIIALVFLCGWNPQRGKYSTSPVNVATRGNLSDDKGKNFT